MTGQSDWATAEVDEMFAEPLLALMGQSVPVPTVPDGTTADMGADFALVLEAAQQPAAFDNIPRQPVATNLFLMSSALPFGIPASQVVSAPVVPLPQPSADHLQTAAESTELLRENLTLPELPPATRDGTALPDQPQPTPSLMPPVLAPDTDSEPDLTEADCGSGAVATFATRRDAAPIAPGESAVIAAQPDIQHTPLLRNESHGTTQLGAAAAGVLSAPAPNVQPPVAAAANHDTAALPASGQQSGDAPPVKVSPLVLQPRDSVAYEVAPQVGSDSQKAALSSGQPFAPHDALATMPQPLPNALTLPMGDAPQPAISGKADGPLPPLSAPRASNVPLPVAVTLGNASPAALAEPTIAPRHMGPALPIAAPEPPPNHARPELAQRVSLVRESRPSSSEAPLPEPDRSFDTSAARKTSEVLPSSAQAKVALPAGPFTPAADHRPASLAPPPASLERVPPNSGSLPPMHGMLTGWPVPTDQMPTAATRAEENAVTAPMQAAEEQPVGAAESGFLLRVSDLGSPQPSAPTSPLPPVADLVASLVPDAPIGTPPDPSTAIVEPSARVTAAQTPAPPEPLRHPPPAEQIAAALAPASKEQPGTIDLVLRPEELGSLRFEMRPLGDRLHVVISAERPETLDMLRRNAPELMAELRQSGLQGSTLQFGQWSQQRSTPPPPQPPEFTPVADLPLPPHPTPQRRASTGLDLRL